MFEIEEAPTINQRRSGHHIPPVSSLNRNIPIKKSVLRWWFLLKIFLCSFFVQMCFLFHSFSVIVFISSFVLWNSYFQTVGSRIESLRLTGYRFFHVNSKSTNRFSCRLWTILTSQPLSYLSFIFGSFEQPLLSISLIICHSCCLCWSS